MKNKNKKIGKDNFYFKKLFNKQLIFPLLILVLGSFLLAKTAFLSGVTEEKIIELTNQERKSLGVGPLNANQLLAKAAYEKARAILGAQSFRHNINNNKFSYWIKQAGYEYDMAGENLAIDFTSGEGIVRAWMKSPTHKKNILNERYKEIGVAVLNGKFEGKDTTLVVQIFGLPKQISLNKTAKPGGLENMPARQAEPAVQGRSQNEIILESELSLKHSVSSAPSDEKKENFILLAGTNKNYLLHDNFKFYSNSFSGNIKKISGLLFNAALIAITMLALFYFYAKNKLWLRKIKIGIKKQNTQLQLPLR